MSAGGTYIDFEVEVCIVSWMELEDHPSTTS